MNPLPSSASGEGTARLLISVQLKGNLTITVRYAQQFLLAIGFEILKLLTRCYPPVYGRH